MAKQPPLFPSDLQISPAASEPSLWVRRLVIWSKPGEALRDIRFRRGLNVIWSPDPGAALGQLGQDSESGHGAGKTILCRLIRYALGESTFANREQRQAISEKFPEGLVGAEIVVAGSTWAVIRPLGTGRRPLAAEDATLESLGSARGDGFAKFREAVSQIVRPDSLGDVVSGYRADSAWPLALAWLSRDQESRFDHLLDWRHVRSESESPVLPIAKDQLVLAVRVLLGIFDKDEIAVRNRRTEVKSRFDALEREMPFIQRKIEDNRRTVLADLGISDDPEPGTGALGAEAIRHIAQERLNGFGQLIMAAPQPRVAELRSQIREFNRRIAVLEEEVRKSDLVLELSRGTLARLNGEAVVLKKEHFESLYGPDCPICFVPIDLALAEGCPISSLNRPRAEIAAEQQRRTEQIAAVKAVIARQEGETRTKRADGAGLRQRCRHLEEELAALEEQARKQRDIDVEARLSASQLASTAAELVALYEQLDRAEAQVRQLKSEFAELGETLTDLVNRQGTSIARFAELFTHVCKALRGCSVDASVRITTSEIAAQVQVGGQAMESLKVVAFDLATMLMGIEGRAGLPAFLIHDSPREADLGESIYHRFFAFAAALEGLTPEPCFQYIITTTSNPPDHALGSDRLVLKLSGSNVNERLLRCDLG